MVRRAGRRSSGKTPTRRWLLLALAPFLSAGVAAGVLAFDRDTGLPALVELEQRIAAARSRLRELRAEQQALQTGIAGLRQGGFAVETLAREALGMIKPGERVLLWETRPRPVEPSSD